MSLKVITINVEGSKHLERWLPYVQQEQPDVLCVQEVFQQDMPLVSSRLSFVGGHFAPMTNVTEENQYKIPPNGLWGVGFFTNLSHGLITEQYYSGSRDVQEFGKPNDVSRVLVKSTIEKEGQEFTVATTHFTWSPDGKDTPEQHADFAALKSLLGFTPDMILCGDFNSPRGGVMYNKFTEVFADGVPPAVVTTIDPNLHYAGPLQLVVDAFFYSPHYKAEQVRVQSGVSDHQSLVGSFSRVHG